MRHIIATKYTKNMTCMVLPSKRWCSIEFNTLSDRGNMFMRGLINFTNGKNNSVHKRNNKI